MTVLLAALKSNTCLLAALNGERGFCSVLRTKVEVDYVCLGNRMRPLIWSG